MRTGERQEGCLMAKMNDLEIADLKWSLAVAVVELC